MQVLITGGAGFIGSHLAEALLREQHAVCVVDDLSTGSRENIKHLETTPEFRFYSGSVCDTQLIASLVRECDVVYHLAAAVGVKQIIQSPVQTIETNVLGTENVLRQAAQHGRRIVLSSTSEVYGKSAEIPFKEDADLLLGATTCNRWSYACSKAIDEFLALAWHREAQLPVTIVRLFNTVGPRQTGRYGMVLPTFVRQALLGEPITIYGNGSQSRCFCHVLDIVEALVAIARNENTVGEIYNLGSTTEVSINHLAALVIAATQSSSLITHIAYEKAYAPGFEDVQRRVPDISKARAAFHFATRQDLDNILGDVIADVRSHLQLRNQSIAMT